MHVLCTDVMAQSIGMSQLIGEAESSLELSRRGNSHNNETVGRACDALKQVVKSVLSRRKLDLGVRVVVRLHERLEGPGRGKYNTPSRIEGPRVPPSSSLAGFFEAITS